ncbi:MAG: biotin--[acetyl-CoA-carboxylase] ligase [Synechococcales cyanobacterium T60_A2020_003]|nr:biotin--[acetyl-CoA-carboxylase] ligase [Synechococcales cyanobacterium T60_A2020_003]
MSLYEYDVVNSTNRVLWDLLAQGHREGTTVIAARQDAGRGQWGRFWQSEPGGLYLSVALEPQCPVAEGGQLMLCTTWGIAAVLRHYGVPVQIKWFNDLVIGRQKLGGILIETRMAQGQISQAVVGVGINWENSVPETGITLKSVVTQRNIPSITRLEEVGAIALNGILAGYSYWKIHGIDPILPAYQSLLTRIGTPIQIHQSSGQVLGVTANGHLRVMELDQAGNAVTELQFKPGDIQLGYR